MTFLSTMVSAGRGTGMVCAVGLQTQIGKIAALMHESREETTPLQKKQGELGKFLSLGSLGICIVLFLLAIVQKRPVFDMLLTAISLAVAAVPEGLPAVVTLCLALSVTRMAKINTIIRRLPSVETLGAVSVVCSDKTGTLTQNKMTVEACFADQKLLPAERMNVKRNRDLFLAMLLCNDAQIEKSRVGDPTELALLDFGARYGFEKNALGTSFERKKENAFDSDRKMMSVLCREQGKLTWYVKGAADRILKRCSQVMGPACADDAGAPAADFGRSGKDGGRRAADAGVCLQTVSGRGTGKHGGDEPDFSGNNRYAGSDPSGGNPCGGGFSEGGRQHGYDHRRPCSDSVCGREKTRNRIKTKPVHDGRGIVRIVGG